MKIAFILTYPIYHDMQMSDGQWITLENRDKWMPAILAEEGHKVELWAVGNESGEYRYSNDRFTPFTIRLFPVYNKHRRSKKDFSSDLVTFAHRYDPDVLFLKGIDGGVGIKLLDDYILPEKKPFIFVIGGKFYNKYVPKAAGVFYETPQQKKQLMHPGLAFIHRKVDPKKLIYLPKSIDTDLFAPDLDTHKEYDIISAGRLINYYKNYDPLGKLSNTYKVALLGDGPLKQKLQEKYPDLHLLGKVSPAEMPKFLNKGRLFFYTGLRDFFPRVIPEAMCTGLPCIGFESALSQEVIPEGCGIRVSQSNFEDPINELLNDPDTLQQYSRNARTHAVDNYGLNSTTEPMLEIMDRLQKISNKEGHYAE